ncbi:MAG: mechanosensitive ion channel domain-containing protein [Cyanobacteria bacterium P01_A01_bin.116]
MIIEMIAELLFYAEDMAVLFLGKAAIAIAILLLGRFVVGLIRNLVKKAMTKAQLEPTLTVFACNSVFYGLMAFVILAALNQLGIETTSLVAVLGAAGLAIGLALQGSLSNFAAGILLVIFQPFHVGDTIEVGSHIGTVTDIQLFTTALSTGDNRKVVVPNSELTENSLVNYSALGQRRVDLVASVEYSADIDRVKQILTELLATDERILQEPAPMVGLLEMADNSLNFAVRPWVLTADYWPVSFALKEAIKKRLDAEGISIPFPQRDVRLLTADGSSASVPALTDAN